MYLTEWLIFKTKSTIIWKQATGYSVAWYFIDLGYKLSQLFSKRDILSALKKKQGLLKFPVVLVAQNCASTHHKSPYLIFIQHLNQMAWPPLLKFILAMIDLVRLHKTFAKYLRPLTIKLKMQSLKRWKRLRCNQLSMIFMTQSIRNFSNWKNI